MAEYDPLQISGWTLEPRVLTGHRDGDDNEEINVQKSGLSAVPYIVLTPALTGSLQDSMQRSKAVN